MTRYGYEHEYDDEDYCHENCVFCVFDIACDGDCGRQDDDGADDEDEEHCEDEGEDGDDTEDDDENDCECLEPLLVTPSEAADLLAISVATLWELVRRDRIRCVEFVASGFKRPIKRFRLLDLEAFCERSLR